MFLGNFLFRLLCFSKKFHFSLFDLYFSILLCPKIHVFLFNLINNFSNQIATNMHSDAYGFVFGINNFLTILSITLFTFVLIDRNGPISLGIEKMV